MSYPTLSSVERTSLDSISVSRVLHDMNKYSTLVMDNIGTGKGSCAAGTVQEKRLADQIARDMKKIGLDVTLQEYPVMRYDYSPVTFKANGVSYEATSLHGAGATYGTMRGKPFALGNQDSGMKIVAPLVYANMGSLQDLQAVPGGVEGKVLLLKRGPWKVYPIVEAEVQKALGIVYYGKFERTGTKSSVDSNLLVQDVFYHHLESPTINVTEDVGNNLRTRLESGESIIVEMSNRVDGNDGISQNVIGQIKGTKYPDEYVLVTAHYDKWFNGAGDNISGLSALLEVARYVASVIRNPKRTHLFIATGSEETGQYATTWDWAAGSYAFIKKYPGVMCRIAYALNFDIFGFTNPRNETFHQISADMIPFHKHTVDQAQANINVIFEPYSNFGVDSWPLSQVGGASVIFPSTTRFLSGIVEPGSQYDYQRFYHTNGDLAIADRFQMLGPELKIALTGLILMNKVQILPVNYDSFISEYNKALNNAMSVVEQVYPNNDFFNDLLSAYDEFRIKAAEVTAAMHSATDQKEIERLNSLYTNMRQEFFPWLHSASLYRVQLYNSILLGTNNIVNAAKNSTVQATKIAIMSLFEISWFTFGLSNIRIYSRETFERERMRYYSNDDWNSAFYQKAALITKDLDRIYYKLEQFQGDDQVRQDVIDLLDMVQNQVRGNLVEALSISEGTFKSISRYIDRFLPPASIPPNLNTYDFYRTYQSVDSDPLLNTVERRIRTPRQPKPQRPRYDSSHVKRKTRPQRHIRTSTRTPQ